MDAHARSLLERLNTSSSPKPLKLSTSETKAIATSVSTEIKPSTTTINDASMPFQVHLANHATLEESEATMSVKDLLVSARHRSRETSPPSSNFTEDTHPAESSSSDTVVQPPSSRIHRLPVKDDRKIVVHTSDGDSSANPEEMPSTPCGSNNSSLISNGAENNSNSQGAVSSNPPPGRRIINDVPSIVTLSSMKPDIPRLQNRTDPTGRTFPGDGIRQIAHLARSFGLYDRDIIGATTKYIVYALKGMSSYYFILNIDGRIRIIDQNTGTRAIAETPSSAPVISLTVQDGFDSEELLLLVLDLVHELTIWSIRPWKVDSADVPYFPLTIALTHSLDYLVRVQTAGRKVDQSFPPIAKWWPRYANCLAVCTGLAVRIYVLKDAQFGQRMDISTGKEAAISIPIETGVRDFSFSLDGSALAVVDYHGDVLLWALCSDPTFSEFYIHSRLKTKLTLSKPIITYVLPPDLNPCSIQFLNFQSSNSGDETSTVPFTPLLLVGSSHNRRLHLVDIRQGMVLQEIVLPSIASESMPAQHFSMAYTKEKQILTLGDTLSNSIFFFHLSSPPHKGNAATSQSDYLVHIAGQQFADKNTGEALPSFDYVTELPFFAHHSLQTLAVTTSIDAYLDVFTAHSKGFTMLSPNMEDILPPNYLDAESALVKSIPNPELNRLVDSSSPQCSASPRSLFRPSSAESTRIVHGRSPPIIKKESMGDIKETVKGDKSPPNNPPDGRNDNPEIVTKDVHSGTDVSEKPRSPSPQSSLPPEQEVVFKPKELEMFLNQALEQQCTILAI